MSEKSLRLAVDIGGTFVDAIELDTATGDFRFRKASTTPRHPSDGVLEAIAALGYGRSEARRWVDGALTADPELATVEDLTLAVLRARGA